jgi:hypothetical protein
MKNLLIVFISFILISCNDCEVKSGVYGDGMLTINVADKVITGVLNIEQGDPEVTCYLKFEFIQNKECNKSVKLIDSFGNEYKAKIELKEKEIFIQSLEQLGACQRVIDLSRGESFSLD